MSFAIAATRTQRSLRNNPLLLMLLFLPVLISLGAVVILDHGKAHKSLFTTTNMLGPTMDSLRHGRGLMVCTEDMGTQGNPICFHTAHMPLAAAVATLGARLAGDRYIPVAMLKTVLLLLPIELAILLVWRRLPRQRSRAVGVVVLLLLPFAIPAFLADVANILVEEGYSYSFLASALALLFFGRWRESGAVWEALLLAVALDGLYLSKSSMLPVFVVLMAGFFLVERRAGLRVLVVLLAASAPVGWAFYTHHVSGRYSVGTSLDGMNLHKGNHAEFLKLYPPLPGKTLDSFDFDLNRGLHFSDEWSFDDYHRRAALSYVRAHPRESFQAFMRKVYVFFFSVSRYGSGVSRGVMDWLELFGMVIFRVLFWVAVGGAGFVLVRRAGPLRAAGGIFLGVVAACALPYLAGFAYTRHVSVLIYPAALMCCRVLAEDRALPEESDY